MLRTVCRFTPLLRRATHAAVLAITMVLLTGCPEVTAIWLVGQAEPGRPVFGIGRTVRGEPITLGSLKVAPCDVFDGSARTAVWFLVQDGPPREVRRVTYGRVPPGYASTRYMSSVHDRTGVAPPLAPGCYVAELEGTGRVRFDIATDGSALERPEEE